MCTFTRAVGALHVEKAVTRQGLDLPTSNRNRMSLVKEFLHERSFLIPAKTCLCFFQGMQLKVDE